MNKLKLDLDELVVESLPTAPETDEADGTVQGHDAPTPPYKTCGCTTGASYLVVFCPPPSPIAAP